MWRAVVEEAGELVLASEIYNYVEPIKIAEGLLEIAVREGAMAQRIKGLQKVLSAATNERWIVSFVPAVGKPTLKEIADGVRKELFDNVLAMPVMQDILRAFPEAELVDVIDQGDE